MSSENDQGRVNDLQRQWRESYDATNKDLIDDLAIIAARLDNLGASVEQRVNDDACLTLAREGFHVCDKAATREKSDGPTRVHG